MKVIKMSLICSLIGHNIEKDTCTRCGMTVCEIKGHNWVYGEYASYGDDDSYKYSKRICSKCRRVKHRTCIKGYLFHGESIETSNWVRIG